jgi:exosortase
MIFQKLARPLFLCFLVVVLYRAVLLGLAEQYYENANYSHGFLIPLFSAYVIWLKRDQLAQIEKRPSFFGFGLVLSSIGLLFLGSIGAEIFLTRISLIGVIAGLILYFLGKPSVRVLAFPLCYLFMMIPLPAIFFNRMVFPLQLLSSSFATIFLQSLRVVPVLREGNLLILPHCTLEIVEACSGVRSLFSLLALALAYGYVAERVVAVRFLLALVMIPMAIAANGLRVVFTALVAHYRGAQTLDGWMHPASSLMAFVVAVVLLLAFHAATTVARRRLTR